MLGESVLAAVGGIVMGDNVLAAVGDTVLGESVLAAVRDSVLTAVGGIVLGDRVLAAVGDSVEGDTIGTVDGKGSNSWSPEEDSTKVYISSEDGKVVVVDCPPTMAVMVAP